MTIKNLWGDFRDIETTRTPALILQEQAGLLAKLTNEVLEGGVTRSKNLRDDNFYVTLDIIAPALGRYRLQVLDLTYHYINVYPVRVRDSINDLEYKRYDEEELMGTLGRILSSNKVQKAIATLISESQMSD
jgi:hypothetical protein